MSNGFDLKVDDPMLKESVELVFEKYKLKKFSLILWGYHNGIVEVEYAD